MRVHDRDGLAEQNGAEERQEGKQGRPGVLVEKREQGAVVHLEPIVHVPHASVGFMSGGCQ